MTTPRKILIVTRQFPPDASVGVQRVAGLCRHLADRGWEVVVIAARPGRSAVADETLMSAVPPTIRVVRTAAPNMAEIAARLLKRRRAASAAADEQPSAKDTAESSPAVGTRAKRLLRTWIDWLSWWLHVPDSFLGWLPTAVWAAVREGRRERPGVVFSSAPAWTAHVAAAVAAGLLRVPLVADFRDPWCGSAFREQKLPHRAHRRANALLEAFVIARAAKVTCAWEGIRRQLQKRYPRRSAKTITVLNGFDPEAIDGVPPVRLDSSAKVFLHAGTFYGPRSPVPLLDALKLLSEGADDSASNVVVAFAGASNYNGKPMAEMVRHYGLERKVRVLGRVSHRESIGLLKGADAAILCGQSGLKELASIPAKAYEYIGTGKPVLAIGAGDEVCRVMRTGGCPVWAAPAEEPGTIAAAIREMLPCLPQEPSDPNPARPERDRFTRGRMAMTFETLLLATIEECRPAAQTVKSRESSKHSSGRNEKI